MGLSLEECAYATRATTPRAFNKRRHMFGERYSGSKINEQDVRDIRLLVSRKIATHAAIGMLYNISTCNVGLIANRKRWKHVE